MKKEKKLLNIITATSDWIIKVVMINVLIISTSLLIVTIIPAFTAGYKLFCDYIKKDEPPLFRTFFKYFKDNIINKIIMTTIIVVLLAISYFSNKYYSSMILSNPSVLSYIGYVITLTLGIVVILTTLYVPVVMSVDNKMTIESTIKYSFYLIFRYILITIVMVFVSILPGLLLLTSITILLLVFAGFSLPLLSIAIITTKPRSLIIKMEETEDETGD